MSAPSSPPPGSVLEVASAEMINIGRRIIANTIAGTTDMAAETYFGDGSVFTDPARFEREREVIFRSMPHVIAWGGDLAEPGDIVARNVAGVPVVATRDSDGTLRAFLNSCTHRGMALCDGIDNSRRLTCPYHGWSFGLDGALVGIPQRDRFPGLDPVDSGLQPLPISEQKGLVLVGLRPDVVVDGYLDPLGDSYSWLGYDTYRSGAERHFNVDANWKLSIDLNVEAYHVPSLHRETLQPFLADHCAVDTFGPHCRMAVPFKGIEAMADVPEQDWPDRLDTIMVTCIFPSTVLVDHIGGGGSLHRISPGATPGQSVIHLIEGAPGPADDAHKKSCEEIMEANVAILSEEDYPATAACQRGYEAGSRRLVGGVGEPLIGHLHRHWDAALDGTPIQLTNS
ncbi:MAG TPA: SRPBCC family protein [Microthrixaceae bacterium]|nr:SRPBCC family protein [Microthrixaceae bacterium]